MSNITNMADVTNDAIMVSPEMALKDALSCIGEDGAFKEGKKLLILCVDDTTGEYNINFIQAGMRMSECLTLCDVSKMLFLEEMKFINQ